MRIRLGLDGLDDITPRLIDRGLTSRTFVFSLLFFSVLLFICSSVFRFFGSSVLLLSATLMIGQSIWGKWVPCLFVPSRSVIPESDTTTIPALGKCVRYAIRSLKSSTFYSPGKQALVCPRNRGLCDV